MSQAPILYIKNLSIIMGGESLFSGLSLSVAPGELIAVIGANGCGKSTLLELIVSKARGEQMKEEDTTFSADGSLFISPGSSVGYLPQTIAASGISSHVTSAGVRADFARCCSDFGVTDESRSVSKLSGGELQKRGLSAVLALDSDLYLLDEPTNYLDIRGITSLEYHLARLKDRGKGILLVTHDRALTDNLADRTVLVSRHDIYVTAGGAGAARLLKAGSLESRRHAAKEISKKIEKLQSDARAKAGWSAASEKRKVGSGSSKPHFAKLSKRMAKRAKVIEHKIERQVKKLTETKPFVPKELNLSVPRYTVRHRDVFQLRHVDFEYPSGTSASAGGPPEPLLHDVTIAASTRDRYCLMGDNGSGKTTLLRLILKSLKPLSGNVSLNEGVKIASIPQRLEEVFTENLLLDNFHKSGLEETVVRQYLGSALIRRDKVHEPVSNFSRGELMRAAAVRCLLMQAEFLILDEPTSNLDIESIEVLEKLLEEFPGGYLIISHDRTFAANAAERLYLLEDGRLRLV